MNTYEKILAALNRVQRCSLITTTLPYSITANNLQVEINNIAQILNASKEECESLIHDLSDILDPNGNNNSIPGV